MNINLKELKNKITPGSHGHLVGIGGVSMSPLAEVLKGRGVLVSGSDIHDSDSVKHLRSVGIPVTVGHRAENIEGADFIVRTAAAHDDNVEIAAARAAGIPVFERAEAWGFLMQRYKNALCISGTHGKTTTTSMSTYILMEAEADPTVMIGGTLPLLNSGYRVGRGNTIVLESCEYYNSFLNFLPTVAVILDIEADHLDFFKDLDDIKRSFRKFAQLVPKDGCVIANCEDANTMDAIAGIDRRVVTFGTKEGADVRGLNVHVENGVTHFDVEYQGKPFAKIGLHVPGRHNVMNALAAIAATAQLDISASAMERALDSFSGAERRFQYKGMCGDAKVYDDYAHHPGEIKALLNAVETLGYKRIVLAFQPHTYTRTKALFGDFAEQLKRPDKVYLAEIYAAREKNTIGISSKDLAAVVPGAVFCPTMDEIAERLKEDARPGDIIITVGAGDIYRVGEKIVKK